MGHYRAASETPFGWRFAGGPIVARIYMLTGIYLFGAWIIKVFYDPCLVHISAFIENANI